MATEDVRVEKGRVKVDRVEGKESIDVALSDVESTTYERGAMGGTGALVLHTKDRDYVIRAEADEVGAVLKKLQTKVSSSDNVAPATGSDKKNAGGPVEAPAGN